MPRLMAATEPVSGEQQESVPPDTEHDGEPHHGYGLPLGCLHKPTEHAAPLKAPTGTPTAKTGTLAWSKYVFSLPGSPTGLHATSDQHPGPVTSANRPLSRPAARRRTCRPASLGFSRVSWCRMRPASDPGGAPMRVVEPSSLGPVEATRVACCVGPGPRSRRRLGWAKAARVPPGIARVPDR